MNNSWLVRPFPHGIKRLEEFKEKKFVAIGWPQIGPLTGKSRENIKDILSKPPYSLTSLKLGSAYATVDIFVNRMEKEDFVLVPDGEDIHFCKITSDYVFNPQYDSYDDGYSHQREVEWLTTVLRNDLSKELRSSLKVQRTAADLTKHFGEIKALATGGIYVPEVLTSDSINVSYPLRPNLNVDFKIPSDISKAEAKRLSMYFESLYYTE